MLQAWNFGKFPQILCILWWWEFFFQNHLYFWVWSLVHTSYACYRIAILLYHVTKGDNTWPYIIIFYFFSVRTGFFGFLSPFLDFNKNDTIIWVVMVMTSLWRQKIMQCWCGLVLNILRGKFHECSLCSFGIIEVPLTSMTTSDQKAHV